MIASPLILTVKLTMDMDISRSKQTRDNELTTIAAAFEMHDALMITDADYNIIRVNHAFEQITGYSEEEVLGKNPRFLKSDRHDKSFYVLLWQALSRNGFWSGEIWDRHKNGKVYPKQITITAIKNKAGAVIEYVASFIDISERKQDELDLRKFRAIVASSDDAIISESLDGEIESWNRGAEQIFGYKAREMIGQTLDPLIPPDRKYEETEIIALIRLGEKVEHFETVRRHKDGRLINISVTVSPIFDANNKVIAASKIARDITTRKKDEQELQKFRALVAYSEDAIISESLDGNIQSWNHGAEQILGYSANEAINHSFDMLITQEQQLEETEIRARIRRRERVEHFETVRRHKDGRLIEISTTISPILNDKGEVIGTSAIARDISNRKKLEDEINRLTYFDILTNLPNRYLLEDRLRQVMALSKRNALYGALMFLSLDNFRPLNDEYGHDTGDLLLIEVATRITSNLREIDTVARFGGDEFVIVLGKLDKDKALSSEKAQIVAEKIRNILSQPYTLKIQSEEKTNTTIQYQCTASIGGVLFVGNEYTQRDILKCADTAMYQAKATGRNSVLLYEDLPGLPNTAK